MSSGRRRAPRDRPATEAAILTAVGVVLARDGFGSFGVNAVARAAGVDKVLIYRYFGGLPELLRAFGEAGDFWPSDTELLAGIDRDDVEVDPADRWASVACNAIRAIRRRPITVEILAWELVEQNDLTRVLEEVRERQWERLVRPGAVHPSGPSAETARAIAHAVAAASYLLARARTIDTYAGLDLHSDATWEALEQTTRASIRAAHLGSSDPVR